MALSNYLLANIKTTLQNRQIHSNNLSAVAVADELFEYV